MESSRWSQRYFLLGSDCSVRVVYSGLCFQLSIWSFLAFLSASDVSRSTYPRISSMIDRSTPGVGKSAPQGREKSGDGRLDGWTGLAKAFEPAFERSVYFGFSECAVH